MQCLGLNSTVLCLLTVPGHQLMVHETPSIANQPDVDKCIANQPDIDKCIHARMHQALTYTQY